MIALLLRDLRLAVRDGRLLMTIADESEQLLEELLLGLARFRRPIREYFAIDIFQLIKIRNFPDIAAHHNPASLFVGHWINKIDIGRTIAQY